MTKKSLRQIRGEYGKAPHHPVNEHARKMRETFQDDDSVVDYRIEATWPTRLYELGQGRSVAYTSNKWKDDPKDFEDYKHVAESPNVTYVTDAFLRHARKSSDLSPNGGEYPVVRPGYEFPPTISELAPFIFFEVRPIESWEDRGGKRKVRLEKDAIQVGIPGCVVYGCYAKKPGGSWSRRSDLKPFLAVIHKQHGVMAIITGKELDVKKDGIVGLSLGENCSVRIVRGVEVLPAVGAVPDLRVAAVGCADRREGGHEEAHVPRVLVEEPHVSEGVGRHDVQLEAVHVEHLRTDGLGRQLREGSLEHQGSDIPS